MPQLTWTQFLIVALPVGIPAMGSMLAAILAQDGFDRLSPYINPVIAYVFLIAASLASAYVEGQLTADVSGLITVCTFLFTLGVSGGLYALHPWLKWLDLLQTYFFAIVKAEEAAYAKPAPSMTSTTTTSAATTYADQLLSRYAEPNVTSYARATGVGELVPISQQTTQVTPAVNVTPNYPSAQMPAINAGDLPTLTFDLGGQQS